MEKISLHGVWRMHEAGNDTWYDAKVPLFAVFVIIAQFA